MKEKPIVKITLDTTFSNKELVADYLIEKAEQIRNMKDHEYAETVNFRMYR